MASATTHIMDRMLRITAALCFVFGIVALTEYFSLFRAAGVMCAGISPIAFGYGYLTWNRLGAWIGGGLLATGILFWFINADLGWQDRYCVLSPLVC